MDCHEPYQVAQRTKSARPYMSRPLLPPKHTSDTIPTSKFVQQKHTSDTACATKSLGLILFPEQVPPSGA